MQQRCREPGLPGGAELLLKCGFEILLNGGEGKGQFGKAESVRAADDSPGFEQCTGIKLAVSPPEQCLSKHLVILGCPVGVLWLKSVLTELLGDFQELRLCKVMQVGLLSSHHSSGKS